MLPCATGSRNVVEGESLLSVVGCVEAIELADLGLELRCRIDTGAKSSALHVAELEPTEDATLVTFVARGARQGRRARARTTLPVHRWAPVRAANGSVETRAFVSIAVRLGGEEFEIEVGLTDRDGMRYPMLLGRSALAGRYLVDPARRYVMRHARDAAPDERDAEGTAP